MQQSEGSLIGRRARSLRRCILWEPPQAVVGDRLPRRRIRDELAMGGPHSRIGIECTEPDARDFVVSSTTCPESRAAGRTEGLDVAVRWLVVANEVSPL